MSNCPVSSTKPSKCCQIPQLPTCPPPCPPPEIKTNKDCNDKKNKCPPMPLTDCSDCKPKWISCTPNVTGMYPVPAGVQILPISVGGRNAKGGACGKCGQDKPAKPKVSANCPMMKPKCPGLAKAEDNSPGLFAKLASLFGKDTEHEAESVSDAATRLEKVCQNLNVEDDKIRHHRNVFNPELVVRKDGYLCPLIDAKSSIATKFRAQCEGDCSCPPPENDCVDEEIQEEDDEDCDYVLEDDDECVEDAEGECILETEEIGEIDAPEESNLQESSAQKCNDQFNQQSSCCNDCRQKGANSCTPMSNFVIRVQAPFSETGSESCETIVDKLCKSRAPMYPDPPKDMPQSATTDQNNNLKIVEIKEEAVTCVCTQPLTSDPISPSTTISSSSCEVTKSPEESRKLPPPPCPPVKPKPQMRKIDPPELAPPENKSNNTCITCGNIKCECNKDLKNHLKDCAGLGTLPAVSPLVQKSEEVDPPTSTSESAESENKSCTTEAKTASQKQPWSYESKPLVWDSNTSSCGSCGIAASNEDLPRESKKPCALPEEQKTETTGAKAKDDCMFEKNDCETLSASEMCRANLATLMCGCPTPPEETSDQGVSSVWNPPPPPSCTYCGAEKRGDNESCAMCAYTRRARDPFRYDWVCPSNIEYKVADNPCFAKEPEKPKCDSDEFGMTPEGTPVYEGGMCLTRVTNFLWKTNPFENTLRRIGFESECYKGFVRCFKGTEVDNECVCETHNKYKGGMSLQEYREFIWKDTELRMANKGTQCMPAFFKEI